MTLLTEKERQLLIKAVDRRCIAVIDYLDGREEYEELLAIRLKLAGTGKWVEVHDDL